MSGKKDSFESDSTSRLEENSMYATIDWEDYFSALFGENNYFGHTGNYNLKKWKREKKKLLEFIKKHIDKNVTSSDFHKNEMIEICDIYIGKIDNAQFKDSVNLDMIIGLSKIVFLLLGRMPYNRDKSRIDFKTDRFRTLHYSQTAKQKCDMIFELMDKTLRADFINSNMYKELKNQYVQLDENNLMNRLYNKLTSEIFNREFNRSHTKFMNWFKKEFEEIYVKMFI